MPRPSRFGLFNPAKALASTPLVSRACARLRWPGFGKPWPSHLGLNEQFPVRRKCLPGEVRRANDDLVASISMNGAPGSATQSWGSAALFHFGLDGQLPVRKNAVPQPSGNLPRQRVAPASIATSGCASAAAISPLLRWPRALCRLPTTGLARTIHGTASDGRGSAVV